MKIINLGKSMKKWKKYLYSFFKGAFTRLQRILINLLLKEPWNLPRPTTYK